MSIQMQERMQILLREAVDTFKKLLTRRDVEEANEAWADAARTHSGQIELIEAAKSGDISAVNYLYLQLIPQVASVFWKNFLGKDSRYRRQRISQGDQFEFAAMVYQSLLSASIRDMDPEEAMAKMRSNAGDVEFDTIEQEYEDIMGTASPLSTFDPTIFDEDTDIITKFGFYLVGALKNEAMKHNRRERRGGLTGNKAKGSEEDASNVSYEDYVDKNDERSEMFGGFHDTEDADSWERLSNDDALDSGREPTARDVLRDFLNQEGNFNVSEVAEKYGTTNQTIRNRLGGMADILERNGIDQSSFARLLKTIGGHELAKAL